MLKKFFSNIINKIKNISLFTSSKKNEINKEKVEEKCFVKCPGPFGDEEARKIPLEKQIILLYKNIDTDLKNKVFFKSKVLFFLSKETTDVNYNRFCRHVYTIKDYSKSGNYEEIQSCPYIKNLSFNLNYLLKFKKFIEKFLRDLKRVDMIVTVNQDILVYLGTLYSFIVYFKDNYIIDDQEAQKLFSIYKEIKLIIKTKSSITENCYGYVNIKYQFPFFESKVIEEYYYVAKYNELDIDIDTGVKYNADNLEDNIKQLIYIFNNRCLSSNTETNNVQYAIKHILKRR